MKKRRILLCDMNSFYASVEQSRDPSLRGKPVIVAGNPDTRSGIVLAASKEAKAHGVKTAMVLAEALGRCPQAAVVRPHMQLYIDVSVHIMSIAQQFTDLVEVYSIDELFIDPTGTERLWGDAWEVARQFRQAVMDTVGVQCSIGIGPNKLVAKVCADVEAKKAPEGIAEWTIEDVPTKMWPLPIRDLFGVGSRMERHFNRMGIKTIGDLAKYPKRHLVKRWGLNGEVYHLSANGIDYSPVTPTTFQNAMKGVGHSITLARDYEGQREIEIVLLELTEEVCRRMRAMKKAGKTVNVYVRDADMIHGFARSFSLPTHTNITMEIYKGVLHVFRKFWDSSPVRAVGMGVTNLADDTEMQLDLFNDKVRKRALGYTMDRIRAKYGSTALMRCASLTKAGILPERASKIGGHYA
jgi:DNA polymerase-4